MINIYIVEYILHVSWESVAENRNITEMKKLQYLIMNQPLWVANGNIRFYIVVNYNSVLRPNMISSLY